MIVTADTSPSTGAVLFCLLPLIFGHPLFGGKNVGAETNRYYLLVVLTNSISLSFDARYIVEHVSIVDEKLEPKFCTV
jgi:hypothetical protein